MSAEPAAENVPADLAARRTAKAKAKSPATVAREEASAAAAQNLADAAAPVDDGLERRTIRGWGSEFGLPDRYVNVNFDRSDVALFTRQFTRAEFDAIEPLSDTEPAITRRSGSTVTVDGEGSVTAVEPRYEPVTPDYVPGPDEFPVPSDSACDGEFTPAPELAALGAALAAEHALVLVPKYTIDYLWRDKGGTSKGRPTLGKIAKISGLSKHYSQYRPDGNDTATDLVVWLAADHLREMRATITTVSAALFHYLCRISETDVPDETPQLRIIDPDFVGFSREYEIFGSWNAGLEKVEKVVQLRMELDPAKPARTPRKGRAAKPTPDTEVPSITIEPTHVNGAAGYPEGMHLALTAKNREEALAIVDAAIIAQNRHPHTVSPYLTLWCASGKLKSVEYATRGDVPDDDVTCPCGADNCWILLYSEPKPEPATSSMPLPVHMQPGGSSAAYL